MDDMDYETETAYYRELGKMAMEGTCPICREANAVTGTGPAYCCVCGRKLRGDDIPTVANGSCDACGWPRNPDGSCTRAGCCNQD